METEGARALLERADTLNLQTGNLLSWGCGRKKCPATPSEEVSGRPRAIRGPAAGGCGPAPEGALGALRRRVCGDTADLRGFVRSLSGRPLPRATRSGRPCLPAAAVRNADGAAVLRRPLRGAGRAGGVRAGGGADPVSPERLRRNASGRAAGEVLSALRAAPGLVSCGG